jgi:pilus assembly protein FimV
VEQNTGSQYDDDLTVGMDEYDDSLETGDVDLFGFVSDEESPITRLKTLILSIDWEITDDILRQFNIELLDLKDIWANNKINLVYVQALEKISKYIYKEKANANPNAIKLLLNFYTNLEKIVSTQSMPEEEKKRLLMEDVEKFEKLKKQISRSSGKPQAGQKVADTAFIATPTFQRGEPLPTDEHGDDPLLNLKAIVFGMDWEITENDLINLGEEVKRLEKRFSNSRAKLIFLQGIGALGAYINLKKSNAHADAFKLLHSFFLCLENVVRNNLTGEEEKKVLFPEVEKFNAFKSAIAFTISPEAIAVEREPEEEGSKEFSSASDDLAPAFADLPEDIRGFQEEEEAVSLGGEAKQKVDGQIEKFFDESLSAGKVADGGSFLTEEIDGDLAGEMESRLNGFFGDLSTGEKIRTSQEVALQGVIVETDADDDSGEDELPRVGDELAPALSDNFEESSFSEKAIAGKLYESESFLGGEDEKVGVSDISDKTKPIEDVAVALRGVEVETEEDDDSKEEPLPLQDEELAPALFTLDDEAVEISDTLVAQEETALKIEDNLASFFGEDTEPEPSVDNDLALQGVDVGTEDEEDLTTEVFAAAEDAAPGLLSGEETAEESGIEPALIQEEVSPGIEENLADFFGDDSIPEPIVDSGQALKGVDVGIEDEEEFKETSEALEEEVSPVAFSSEEALGEDDQQFVLAEEESLFEEETEPEREGHQDEYFIDDSTKKADVRDVEAVFDGLDIQADVDASVTEGTGLFQDSEVAPGLFEGEEDLAPVPEEGQDLQAEKLPAEFEDQLQEFFADDGSRESLKEDAEIDFSEVVSEVEKETESDVMETVSFTEEEPFSASIELKDEEFAVEKEPTELDTSVLFEVDEGTQEEIAEETIEEKSLEGVEIEEFKAIEEEEKFGFTIDSDIREFEPDISMEKPEEAVFTVAEEEPLSISAELQDDNDFIEYIEGVEFDSEEADLETDLKFVEKTEEVVFEAADVRSTSEAEGDEQEKVLFSEAVEELEKYFTEHSDLIETPDKDREELEKADEFFGPSETFGESFEEDQSPVGSEILMEVFPEIARKDKVPISEEPGVVFTEEPLSEQPESEEEELVFAESELHFEEDQDSLSQLRSCIASLGLDITDGLLKTLFDEVDNLRSIWTSQPIQKTFLQLLSTIAHHMDHYRDEASPEAHGLLMSVFDKLELSRISGTEDLHVQEALLTETSKVLLWQQKMLTRQALEQSEEPTSLTTSSGGSGAQMKESSEVADIFDRDDAFQAVFESTDGVEPAFIEEERQHDEIEDKAGTISEQGIGLKTDTKISLDDLETEKIARIVRNELETLRLSFRKEMADLLREQFDKTPAEKND